MSKDDELEPEWETYESCCWKVFAINCFVLPTFSSSQINTDKATILKKFSIACGKHVFSKLNGCFMKPNTHLPILLLSNMFFFCTRFRVLLLRRTHSSLSSSKHISNSREILRMIKKSALLVYLMSIAALQRERKILWSCRSWWKRFVRICRLFGSSGSWKPRTTTNA